LFALAPAAAAGTPYTDPAEIIELVRAALLPSKIAAGFLAAVQANDA